MSLTAMLERSVIAFGHTAEQGDPFVYSVMKNWNVAQTGKEGGTGGERDKTDCVIWQKIYNNNESRDVLIHRVTLPTQAITENSW